MQAFVGRTENVCICTCGLRWPVWVTQSSFVLCDTGHLLQERTLWSAVCSMPRSQTAFLLNSHHSSRAASSQGSGACWTAPQAFWSGRTHTHPHTYTHTFSIVLSYNALNISLICLKFHLKLNYFK